MLHYVGAAARRKTGSRSRSCFLPEKWRALEQSNSLVRGWSAGLPCAPGSAAATHTCASRAAREQTDASETRLWLNVSTSGSFLELTR